MENKIAKIKEIADCSNSREKSRFCFCFIYRAAHGLTTTKSIFQTVCLCACVCVHRDCLDFKLKEKRDREKQKLYTLELIVVYYGVCYLY
jgi:hypothetical protein